MNTRNIIIILGLFLYIEGHVKNDAAFHGKSRKFTIHHIKQIQKNHNIKPLPQNRNLNDRIYVNIKPCLGYFQVLKCTIIYL